MRNINSDEFNKWDDALIKLTLNNIVDQNTINMILLLRGNIQSVLNDIIDEEEYPGWFAESLDNIMRQFIGIFRQASINNSQLIQQLVTDFRLIILYGFKKDTFQNIYYTLPFLEGYARSYKLNKKLSNLESINNTVDSLIDQYGSNVVSEINSLEEKFNKFKTEADATLALLNKQAGKIGVKDYAEIFDKQALEHSSLFIDKDNQENRKYSIRCFGKAQRWLAFAIIAFILIIIAFTQLDRFFSLKDQYLFTPEVTVHIVGRFLLISLFIFIISFSFKQFRVNMHLYTLNRHRANTLKSFEYLTRAPDQLAPESYNAILMQVAKAIYESGQTGYISDNEGHTDIPSIVDMSKIITQPKNG